MFLKTAPNVQHNVVQGSHMGPVDQSLLVTHSYHLSRKYCIVAAGY